MDSKSFSFSMIAAAFEGWKRTVPRDKPLHNAIPEDLARVALDRDDGELSMQQREACRQLIDNEGVESEIVVEELEETD
jgi:hypothetical protein